MDMLRFGIFGSLILGLLTGCQKEEAIDSTYEYYNSGGTTVTTYDRDGEDFHFVSGEITNDFTFSANKNWVLDGQVKVADGGHLIIEPGTTIYGKVGSQVSVLSVQKGGFITAVGTEESPIVFSSFSEVVHVPNAGDWGGIIINGKAPVDSEDASLPQFELTGDFGGNNIDDGSGILKHVVIKYAGRKNLDGYGLNGLSLNGVGSSTVVDFIEVIDCSEEGIGIYGGAVTVSNTFP